MLYNTHHSTRRQPKRPLMHVPYASPALTVAGDYRLASPDPPGATWDPLGAVDDAHLAQSPRHARTKTERRPENHTTRGCRVSARPAHAASTAARAGALARPRGGRDGRVTVV